MSYRETRNFLERLRALGYPKPIFTDSFRIPNFELMSDILKWLAKTYDPKFNTSESIGTQNDRVQFIKSTVIFFMTKAHLKLNPKKLYSADGYAVQEMLKIANLLYEASVFRPEEDTDDGMIRIDISSKFPDMKAARTLASDITTQAAELYDILGKELEQQDMRSAVLARPFELKAVESAISNAYENLEKDLKKLTTQIEQLTLDDISLKAKVEKKDQELERAKKRLKSLQSVRPAYMDEFEKIEAELISAYDAYVVKFRSLAYLEQQVEEFERVETEDIEEMNANLRKLQEKFREEESKILKMGIKPGMEKVSGFITKTDNKNNDADNIDDDDHHDDDENDKDNDELNTSRFSRNDLGHDVNEDDTGSIDNFGIGKDLAALNKQDKPLTGDKPIPNNSIKSSARRDTTEPLSTETKRPLTSSLLRQSTQSIQDSNIESDVIEIDMDDDMNDEIIIGATLAEAGNREDLSNLNDDHNDEDEDDQNRDSDNDF